MRDGKRTRAGFGAGEKFSEILIRKLQEKITEYQNCINRGQFDQLERLLLDEAVIMILPAQKRFVGKRAVVDFWRRQKESGLKTVKFEVLDLSIIAHEMLVRKGRVPVRYDHAAWVVGTYSITRRAGAEKLALPNSTFVINARHADDCNWGLGKEFLG